MTRHYSLMNRGSVAARPPQASRTYDLRGGTMRLSFSAAPDRMGVDDLLLVAERENPKRPFLFVSTVLGRHIPVRASVHRRILSRIADEIAPAIPAGSGVLVFGFAETAIGLGAGVHDELCRRMPDETMGFLPSTRHPDGREVWFGFDENHSHATAHNVLVPGPGPVRIAAQTARTLVLVDDEATTGNTFSNVVRSFREAGRVFDRIILVTLTDWSGGSAQVAVSREAGLPEDAVTVISLLEGSHSWDRREDAVIPVLPVSVEALSSAGIDADLGAWRRGIWGPTDLTAAADAAEGVISTTGGQVLVIGTGELVWQAFRLAEELSARGQAASFLATTRSPVLQGSVIRHKVAFPDHYGLGVPMYLHNVDPRNWSSIILLTEGGDDLVPPALARHLDRFAAVRADGRITLYAGGKPA